MPYDEEIVRLFLLPLGPKLQLSEWEKFGISFEEREKINQYKHWQDWQRAILGSTLLRWMLKTFLNLGEVKISRNEKGRPYLLEVDKNWNVDFNLSHSGEWIVAAITKNSSVGVDVEKIEELNEDILPFVLSEKELMTIKRLSKYEQTKKFYELWTIKESIYKTGLFPNLTLESINTFEFNKKDIKTHTFYIDQHHPVAISWHGAHTSIIKKTVLTRDKILD